MFIKKLASYLAIILSFTSVSFNSYAQESDNFLLLYESYNKLNKIEEIIENSETKILTKYSKRNSKQTMLIWKVHKMF